MEWRWKKFSELTTEELYQVISLRERVFVVEQNCVYLDCDGSDPRARHLLGFENGKLLAYARAFGPGVKYPEASLGRVVTAPEARGKGLGRQLMEEILRRMGEGPVRISAQKYLQPFYESLGFAGAGEDYLEDRIPHVEMLKK